MISLKAQGRRETFTILIPKGFIVTTCAIFLGEKLFSKLKINGEKFDFILWELVFWYKSGINMP